MGVIAAYGLGLAVWGSQEGLSSFFILFLAMLKKTVLGGEGLSGGRPSKGLFQKRISRIAN
jgi:hypothetical protein